MSFAGPRAKSAKTARKKAKPRAGSAASAKAMMTRRLKYGKEGLTNETKKKMIAEGQNVG